MRLSQLARKLDKSPTEILHFFKTNKLGSYSSHNDKLEDEHEKFAISNFNPELLNDPEEVDEPSTNEISILTKESDTDEFAGESNIEPIEKPKAEIEVIRAPKIKLEGVKVVGKIELPEKVLKPNAKKEVDVNNEEPTDIITEKREIKIINKKNRGNSKRKISYKKKKLSYEERLKFEEKERKRKQREEDKKRKELKKVHYKKNIQSTLSEKKKIRKSPKRPIEVKREIPVYKNPIRKLWAWLNGEYDRH